MSCNNRRICWRLKDQKAIIGLWKKQGLDDDFVTWKKQILRILETSTSQMITSMWDYSTINHITAESIPARHENNAMKYYCEPIHFTPKAGDEMLSEKLDFKEKEIR